MLMTGLPGDGSARPLVWRLILNYLPPDRSEWEAHVAKKRSNYAHFLEDLVSPGGGGEQSSNSSSAGTGAEGNGAENGGEGHDHPLNPNPDSRWQQFFRDNEVLLQIDKDVRRLLPEIAFFQSPTK